MTDQVTSTEHLERDARASSTLLPIDACVETGIPAKGGAPASDQSNEAHDALADLYAQVDQAREGFGLYRDSPSMNAAMERASAVLRPAHENSNRFGPLDFIACNLYRRQCYNDDVVGAPWNDLPNTQAGRQQWLTAARLVIEEWVEKEGPAQKVSSQCVTPVCRQTDDDLSAGESGFPASEFEPSP